MPKTRYRHLSNPCQPIRILQVVSECSWRRWDGIHCIFKYFQKQRSEKNGVTFESVFYIKSKSKYIRRVLTYMRVSRVVLMPCIPRKLFICFGVTPCITQHRLIEQDSAYSVKLRKYLTPWN